MSAKILYIINHIDWFWSHRLPLARKAREKGYEVIVACKGAGENAKLGEYGFKGIDLPGRGALSIIRELRRIISEEKPDILHVITIKFAFLSGLASLGLKVPKIVHTIAGLGYLYAGEGLKPCLLRFVIKPFMKLALKRKNTRLIFQNPDDRELMIKKGIASPARSHLIRGSGVDTRVFPEMPEPEDEIPLVLMPTRLVHEKGVAVFIEAARLLKEKNIPARFAIAGGITKHNPRAITEAEMKEMTRDSTVEWMGKVADMPDLLAKSTLVVYPSYYGEGIPKVLLEAASTGRAIITTDHPGCREIVKDGENGLLVPVRDAAATEQAMMILLERPEQRQSMAKKSRTLAENEFSIERVVRETLAVYEAESAWSG